MLFQALQSSACPLQQCVHFELAVTPRLQIPVFCLVIAAHLTVWTKEMAAQFVR